MLSSPSLCLPPSHHCSCWLLLFSLPVSCCNSFNRPIQIEPNLTCTPWYTMTNIHRHYRNHNDDNRQWASTLLTYLSGLRLNLRSTDDWLLRASAGFFDASTSYPLHVVRQELICYNFSPWWWWWLPLLPSRIEAQYILPCSPSIPNNYPAITAATQSFAFTFWCVHKMDLLLPPSLSLSSDNRKSSEYAFEI